MANKLKPCPFCGSNDIFIDENETFIMCHNCNCIGPDVPGIGVAVINAWNNRAEDNNASNS